ncbi:MAG: YbjQ family protein [Lentisphaeria bacterium]|nr:YbjQ family protein [Lentisphaeria bacterium]
MLILTTPIIEGYQITEYVGLVTAKNVRAVNVIRDFLTSFRDIFGGRSGSYQEVMDEIQREVIAEIGREASDMGANAIIGFSLDFDNVGSKGKSLIMAFAKGTAVVIEGLPASVAAAPPALPPPGA